ncbi:MAG: hypothetical protein Q9M20_02535 [Mariprofundaceae bacterium]|nr:hypothetical protein [Mariprofundaceae bacterium]
MRDKWIELPDESVKKKGVVGYLSASSGRLTAEVELEQCDVCILNSHASVVLPISSQRLLLQAVR